MKRWGQGMIHYWTPLGPGQPYIGGPGVKRDSQPQKLRSTQRNYPVKGIPFVGNDRRSRSVVTAPGPSEHPAR